MKRTKKLLSFFLAIMMVITTIPAFTLTTNAATTVKFTNTGYKLISGNTNNVNNRYGKDNIKGRIEVCNDGGDGNFNAGFWTFSMPTLPSNAVVDSASITAEIPYAYSTNQGVKFYATNGDFTTTNSFKSTKTNETINYVVKSGNNRAADAYALFNGYTMKDLGTFSGKNVTNTSFTSNADTIKEAVKYAVENNWKNFNIFAYQPNSGNGSGSNWSDTSIKLPTISLTYSLKTYTLAELKTLMNQFENNGAIYYYNGTNLYNAYTAYVAASKVYDAAYYGGNSSVNITEAYTNLKSAMGNIDTWNSGVTKVAAGTLSGNTATYVDGTHYQNLLYSTNITDSNDSNTGKGNNRYFKNNQGVDLEIYYPKKTVMCYDGSGEPMFPVLVFGANTDRNLVPKRLYKLYPAHESYTTEDKLSTYGRESSQFACAWEHWYGRGGDSYGSLDFFGPTNNSTTQKVQINSADNSTDYHGFDGPYLTWTGGYSSPKYNQFSNVIKYTATPSSALEKTYINWFWTTGQSGPDHKYVGKASNQLIYILNYKGIKEQIDAKSNLFARISDYKEDSGSKFSTALSGYDVLASYNYKAIDYSGDLDTLQTRLNDAYTKIKNNTPVADDTKGFPTIRATMDKSMAIFDGKNSDGKYTTSSFAAFNSAYTTAKTAMSYVVTLGYDDPMTDANTIAKNLKDAYDNLKQRANFTALASQYSTAATKLAETDKYTTSTYNALKDSYDNAEYAKYNDTQKANTSIDKQSAIDTEKDNIANAIAALVQRANFNAYDIAMETATTVDGYLKSYTTTTPNSLPPYSLLSQYNGITIYEDKDNIPATKQNEISDVTYTLGNLNSKIFNCEQFIDQTALKAFINQNFDLDVVDKSNITDQKNSAKGLYETVTFNGTDYYSLNVASQSDLNEKLRGYLNSINSTLGEYDIKVPENADIKVTAGGVERTADSIAEGFKTYKLTYGVPVTFTSENEDTAWYMKYKSNVAQRGMQYQCSGETYATKVMGNMTITPKARVENSTPYKVTVVRQYSNGGSSAMLIDYVGNSFTLPAVQTYPNYTFREYEVNGKAYNAGGTEVTITGDTVIYAKYDALGNDCAIKITKTDGTTTTADYKYNSAVSLNDPNAYAWIEKPIGGTWRPSYIGTGCSYKVTEPMELKAVATVDEMKQLCGTKEAYEPNLRYNGPLVANDMGVVFHGQFINYVPEGAQIVEYGVAVNTNNANSFDLINTNGKVIRCKSTNPMKSNQFSVGARYNGDTFTSRTAISYRSYMIYQITVNNQLETRYVYSDIRTFNPNPNA